MLLQSLSSQPVTRLLLTAVLFVALAALPGAASAIDVTKVAGDGTCPSGKALLSVADAQANASAVCAALGQWDIARLAGGGSMDGPGYNCQIRASDARQLGHSLCRPAPPTVVTWDGTCTPSQVAGRGGVTLTKTPNGNGYDVTLDGKLTINSPTYGYVRHAVPPGFLPVSTDPLAYTCAVQQSATKGDTSAVGNYGGKGVHIRNDNFTGYVGRATIWFPEKFYNGEFTLRCTWKTNEATNPSTWQGCAGIKIAP